MVDLAFEFEGLEEEQSVSQQEREGLICKVTTEMGFEEEEGVLRKGL